MKEAKEENEGHCPECGQPYEDSHHHKLGHHHHHHHNECGGGEDHHWQEKMWHMKKWHMKKKMHMMKCMMFGMGVMMILASGFMMMKSHHMGGCEGHGFED